MADFAEVAMKVANVFGFARSVDDSLQRLSQVQTQFTIHDEPLLEMLDEWLKTQTNIGRWIATRALFKELYALDSGTFGGVPFEIKNQQALGHRLTDLRSTLETALGYEERSGRSNVREVRFTRQRSIQGMGEGGVAERIA